MFGEFVRNAPWLKFAFQPSSQPDPGPGRYSPEVYLTSDYYGGGYSFRDGDQWFSSAGIAKAADNTFVAISINPTNQLTRVIALGITQFVGAQTVALTASYNIQNGPGTITVPFAPVQTIIPAGAPAGYPGYLPLPSNLLIGPSPQTQVIFFGTGDNVQYVIVAYFVTVPRGVTFNH